MPYDDPDPTDPNVLVGVSLPGDEAATREMAMALAEEFAALGFDGERLMSLFRRPHYAGAHRAYELLGEKEIEHIIGESLSVWGNYRVSVRDKQASSANDELVQIDLPPKEEHSPEPMRSRPPAAAKPVERRPGAERGVRPQLKKVDGASGVGPSRRAAAKPDDCLDGKEPGGGGAPRALRLERKDDA